MPNKQAGTLLNIYSGVVDMYVVDMAIITINKNM
jgi:hypothetical protein